MAGQAVEVAGCISTFGTQVLSNRPTKERTRFGTSGRVEAQAEWDFKRFGATSTGHNTQPASSFGPQHASRCSTAPSYRFANKYVSDHDMTKEGRPGPGSYELQQSVGKQVLSYNPNLPNWKIGTGTRFSTYKTIWKSDFASPGPGEWRPSAGWLGDAPKYTFHGKSRRADISTGLVGNKPTCVDDPGPGMYEVPSSLGAQHDSRKTTSSRTRVGTADRDQIRKAQYPGPKHEVDLYGKHSPAPNLYNPTKSLAMTSRVQTPQSFRFGSGDRFSQVKSRDSRRLPGPAVPGPGTYVV